MSEPLTSVRGEVGVGAAGVRRSASVVKSIFPASDLLLSLRVMQAGDSQATKCVVELRNNGAHPNGGITEADCNEIGMR